MPVSREVFPFCLFTNCFPIFGYYRSLDHFSCLCIHRKSDLPICAIFLSHLRHSDVVSSRSVQDLEVSHTKTVVDGNVCVSHQVTLIDGEDSYACDLHEDYESVFAFLIAVTHNRRDCDLFNCCHAHRFGLHLALSGILSLRGKRQLPKARSSVPK